MGRQRHTNASPTERAIDECKARGWRYERGERWKRAGEEAIPCPHCGEQVMVASWVRTDLCGCGDLLALDRANNRHILIQVTTGSNHAARVRKICRQPMGDDRQVRAWNKRVDLVASWLESGGEILVWSWKRNKELLERWVMRETVITLDDLELGPRQIQRVL